MRVRGPFLTVALITSVMALSLGLLPYASARPTYLEFGTPDRAVEGEEVGLLIVLQDAEGRPLPGATVTLYAEHTFTLYPGRASIGSVTTDEAGKAEFRYVAPRPGVLRLEAEYQGGIVDRVVMDSSKSKGGFYVTPDTEKATGTPYDELYNWGIWAVNRPHEEHVPSVYTETIPSLLAVTSGYVLISIAYSILIYVIYQLYRISRAGE